jgi:hypothetical protein
MVKRFIAVFLLIVLLSACKGQISTPAPAAEELPPVLSYTLESPAVATATPLIVMATEEQASPTVLFAGPFGTPPVCLGAPAPHVSIGQQVTVVVEDFDKLKLRSAPEISPDTEKLELDKFTQLKILEGPVCVADAETEASYWFWKVGVLPGAEIGWVAEGDSLHYFIE